jgi:SAM-dependent methyltransferase
MIGVGRRRTRDDRTASHARASFDRADLHAPLPFATASFDAVLCALIGEHLRELATPLGEMRRVLVDGGRLVLSVYHPAMAARGKEANFERSGIEYRLGAELHTLEGYRSAFERAGFATPSITEHAIDEALVRTHPDAARDLGSPCLLVLRATR